MKGIKDQTQYHHGDLKAAILEHSAKIISEEGIEALSLRAVARDLGVSHGAPGRHFKNKAQLLAALTSDIWQKLHQATLQAADQAVEKAGSDDPLLYLNALGRGYLRWALANRSAFQAINHPDLRRYVDDNVKASQEAFQEVIDQAVCAAQKAGRHPKIDLKILTLYTTSVPFGTAMLLSNALTGLGGEIDPEVDQEKLIEDVIALVVPLT